MKKGAQCLSPQDSTDGNQYRVANVLVLAKLA